MNRGVGAAFGLWLAMAAAPPPGVLAQEGPEGASARVVARLSADTVRVGDPFTVGVAVRPRAGTEVRLPALIAAENEVWEQLEVARVERGEDGLVRGYYSFVAWRTGPLALPDLELRTSGAAGGSGGVLSVQLPAPYVRSVLPADAEQPGLRGPRPPFDDGFPWLVVLLLGLLALAAAWWLWRWWPGKEADECEPGPRSDAGELARQALVELKRRIERREVGGAAAYDRLEEILRGYLSATHDWPPALPVRASSAGSGGLPSDLHRRAVLARFGGVTAAEAPLLEDLDASIDWLAKAAA